MTFDCSGGSGIEAMENEYIAAPGYGPCWGHLGHHTYDAGAVYRVGTISGRVFSVEIQFSPPTEVDGAAATLLVEGSVDGRAWRTLGTILYPFRGGSRQGIDFTVDAGGALARFIRVRQPRSAAQGLSGYLDSSVFVAEVEPAPAGPVEPLRRSLTCEDDVMERFFEAHPCWFGGLNRYDAPSAFHTYALGGTHALSGIDGSVTFLPWRTDDYFSGSGYTAIGGWVQTSTDGVNWTNAGRVSGTYGVPIPFSIELPGPVDAAFIRLVADYHSGYTRHPALKHVRGMLFDSRLELTPTS